MARISTRNQTKSRRDGSSTFGIGRKIRLEPIPSHTQSLRPKLSRSGNGGEPTAPTYSGGRCPSDGGNTMISGRDYIMQSDEATSSIFIRMGGAHWPPQLQA